LGTRLPDKAPERPPEGSPDDSRALIGGLQHSVTRRSTGSQERWASLKKLYDAHLLAHARSRIGAALLRVLDPEEVVDEAWIRVFEAWDDFQYEKKHSLRSWLCLQVDRVILDRCRRERRRPPEVVLASDTTTGTGAEIAEPGCGPATVVARRDRREALVRAIDELPEIYRRALRAIWLEEKSRDEVAKELDIKPNTLTVQLRRGMELLRERLDQDLL
jgi:RNA polymerase sigma factor (sigma-70 family)